jgi:cell division septum initiation protein DivIVA
VQQAEERAREVLDRATRQAEDVRKRAQREADDLLRKAQREAENLKREKLIEAKDEWLRKKQEFDQEVERRRTKLQEFEQQLKNREFNLDRRADQLNLREQQLREEEQRYRRLQAEYSQKLEELEALRREQNQRLERIAGLTAEEARQMLIENMLEEGLKIVDGVRSRHNGIARNPWNEFECGHHYARAMANWSLLTALSGFRYNAPEKKIAFGPKVCASNFKCFYSTGTGWGTYQQEVSENELIAKIGVTGGELELSKVKLDIPSDNSGATIRANINGYKPVEASCERKGDFVMVTFAETVKIAKDQYVEIVIS